MRYKSLLAPGLNNEAVTIWGSHELTHYWICDMWSYIIFATMTGDYVFKLGRFMGEELSDTYNWPDDNHSLLELNEDTYKYIEGHIEAILNQTVKLRLKIKLRQENIHSNWMVITYPIVQTALFLLPLKIIHK